MASNSASKIILQLKNHQSTSLSITDLLYLLNNLISSKPHPLSYVHKFIHENYSHEEIAWKAMDEQTIESMQQEQLQYIRKRQKEWKVQADRQTAVQSEYLEEKKRIRKILKEKSFTKEQLIDTYLQEIRRNKTILSKSVSQKSKDLKDTKEVSDVAQKLKYEQNIELLQKRINIMRDAAKFDSENDQKLLENNTYSNSKYAAREKELNKLVQEFQFKKQYFQDIEMNSQLEQAFQKKKKLSSMSKSLNRRLKQLFLKYSSQNYDPAVSFEKNNQKLVHIDLRLFLKYFKELKESFSGGYFIDDEKNDKILKTNNLTMVFRKYARNQRQINFVQFLNINYELFLNSENAYEHLSEEHILGEEKKEKEKSEVFNHSSLNQIDEQLEKLQEIKDVFFNQKVNRIINVNDKQEEVENPSQLTQRSSRKTSNSEGTLTQNKRTKQNKMQKMIDKTLQDYETTRNKIHETFMIRHRKETLESLEQRLNTSAHESPNNIKIVVNKSQRKGVQKTVKNMRGKDERQTLPRNKTEINISINKNIFSQIIKEVEEENEEENQTAVKIGSLRSKSNGNILSARDLSKVTNPKNRASSLSSRLVPSNQTTSSLKSIFTLPRITRMSQERLENQSITKTLSYLYNVLGKQEELRIKKILELDNREAVKANKIQNQYLNEYFDKEGHQQVEKQKQIQELMRQKKQQIVMKPSCKKFKEQNYQKFMKFS